MTRDGFLARYAMLPAHLRDRPTPKADIFAKNPGADRYVSACTSLVELQNWFGDHLDVLRPEGGHVAIYEVPDGAVAFNDGQQVAYQQSQAVLIKRTGTTVDPESLLHRVHKSIDDVPSTMSYTPSLHYERTEAESDNQELSWARSNIAFFASGGCHILAWAFIELDSDGDFEIIHIRPKSPNNRGHHVYASNGHWAFDYFGWTPEQELLAESAADYGSLVPGWAFDRVVVTSDLETFCKENHHRLPSEFAHSPWDRAKFYLARFDSKPPVDGLEVEGHEVG